MSKNEKLMRKIVQGEKCKDCPLLEDCFEWGFNSYPEACLLPPDKVQLLGTKYAYLMYGIVKPKYTSEELDAIINQCIEDNRNHECRYKDYGWIKVCTYCGKKIIPVSDDVLDKIKALEEKRIEPKNK